MSSSEENDYDVWIHYNFRRLTKMKLLVLYSIRETAFLSYNILLYLSAKKDHSLSTFLQKNNFSVAVIKRLDGIFCIA